MKIFCVFLNIYRIFRKCKSSLDILQFCFIFKLCTNICLAYFVALQILIEYYVNTQTFCQYPRNLYLYPRIYSYLAYWCVSLHMPMHLGGCTRMIPCANTTARGGHPPRAHTLGPAPRAKHPTKRHTIRGTERTTRASPRASTTGLPCLSWTNST